MHDFFSFAVRSFVHSTLSPWMEWDGKFVFNLAWYVYVSAAKYEITFERKTENEFENWNRGKLLYWAFFYVNNFLIWHASFFILFRPNSLFFQFLISSPLCMSKNFTHTFTLSTHIVAKQKVICFLSPSLVLSFSFFYTLSHLQDEYIKYGNATHFLSRMFFHPSHRTSLL